MKNISVAAKKRLITLSQLLGQLSDSSVSDQSPSTDEENTSSSARRITSVELSRLTGWTNATIRRDISLLELHSGVSNGYNTAALKKAIDTALNLTDADPKNVCIVGLGGIGERLLDSAFFEGSNFHLTAAFDTNQNRLDLIKSDIPLFPTLDLEPQIRRLKIQYAILATADDRAQFMADRLARYGIKSIINYTATVLTLPPEVQVLNASPAFLLKNLE